MAYLGTDTTGIDPAEGAPEPLPPGWYTGFISESEAEMKEAESKLKTKWVIDIDNTPNKVWFYLTLPTGRDVNRQTSFQWRLLAALQAACGVFGALTDSQQLHNIRFAVKLKRRPATAEWPAKNEPQEFKPMAQAAEVLGPPPPSGQPAAAVAPPVTTLPVQTPPPAAPPVPPVAPPVAAAPPIPLVAQTPPAVVPAQVPAGGAVQAPPVAVAPPTAASPPPATAPPVAAATDAPPILPWQAQGANGINGIPATSGAAPA